MEPQVTRTERMIGAALLVSIAFVMIAAVYIVRARMKPPPDFALLIPAAFVIGFGLLMVGSLAIDRFRRGGYARHALERLKKGSVQDRIDAVTVLHETGGKSAYYIESIQREGRMLGKIQIAESQRLLDLYVLPGLAAAAQDNNPIVRRHARQALEDLGTWEAAAMLESTAGRSGED